MTANAFEVHQCTVSKTLVLVREAISEILGPQLIKLPQNSHEI